MSGCEPSEYRGAPYFAFPHQVYSKHRYQMKDIQRFYYETVPGELRDKFFHRRMETMKELARIEFNRNIGKYMTIIGNEKHRKELLICFENYLISLEHRIIAFVNLCIIEDTLVSYIGEPGIFNLIANYL